MPDIESLLEVIDDDADVYIIDSNANGIEQVANILANHVEVDAVHILSHGTEAGIQLGNTEITPENLNEYEAQLQLWSDGLSDNADILFYGCDIGANKDGELFIESISLLTGADKRHLQMIPVLQHLVVTGILNTTQVISRQKDLLRQILMEYLRTLCSIQQIFLSMKTET